MNSSRNRQIYNHDVIANGGYLYTGKRIYSASIATKKQTVEIHRMIQKFFPAKIRILDMGCGDGTYTIEMARSINPLKITGFDVADAAIKSANQKIRSGDIKSIKFDVGDVYNLSRKYKSRDYNLGIFRGVLHHLDQPETAILQASQIIDNVIVLEPNGFNPILKLIEKISPYHLQHGEKSYWPPQLDSWFRKNGYEVVAKKYFSIVPYFCPNFLTKILKTIEPFFETIPIINRFYCGGVLIFYRKSDPT